MATAARIRALLVGINAYPNLPENKQLHGCIADTENIRDLLITNFAADAKDIRLLHDERATKSAVLSRLTRLVHDTKVGDVAVLHWSGHGSLITRRQPSGALMDHSSEILCLSAIPATLDDPHYYITDSDLSPVLKGLRPGALLVVLLDACYSGATTIARGLTRTKSRSGATRFLTPPVDLQNRDDARRDRFTLAPNVERGISLEATDNRHRMFARSASTIDARVFVLTACGPDQTSSDARFGTGETAHFEGAFTHDVCAILGSDPRMTYQGLLDGVRGMLLEQSQSQVPEFLPADCVGRSVFQPLDSARVATFAEHLVNRPLEGELRVIPPGAETRLMAQPIGIAPPAASDDPRLRRVLDELRGSGFVVQPPFTIPVDADVSRLATRDANPDSAPTVEPTRVQLDIPDGYDGMLMEFQDGVIVWHKARERHIGRAIGTAEAPPARRSTKRARGVARSAASGGDQSAPTTRRTLEFQLYSLPPSTVERAAAQSEIQGADRGFGDAMARVFHAVIHPVQTVTRLALREIESHVFDEGLYHFHGNSLVDNATKNPAQMLPIEKDGVVLFIHGIFSSVAGAFGKAPITALLPDLQSHYTVLGYNHLSTTVSLDEVAMQLDHRLRACIPDGTRLRIVAHSQGGVIARQLACLRPVDRIITFGSPLRGTHLADGIERWISVFTTINTVLPTFALGFITKLLKVIDDPDVIPGLLDMKVGCDYLAKLDATTPKISSSYYTGQSDFRPSPSDSVFARIAERVEQWAIFPNENDLVVDTSLMIPPSPIPLQDDVLYDERDHVSHVGYFEQVRTADFIRRALL